MALATHGWTGSQEPNANDAGEGGRIWSVNNRAEWQCEWTRGSKRVSWSLEKAPNAIAQISNFVPGTICHTS